MVSTVNGSWVGRESDGGSDVEEGTGSGDEGTSRPATNITGASCTTSSGGYEFILRSSLSEDTETRNSEESRAPKQHLRSVYHHPPNPILYFTSFGGNVPCGTDVTCDSIDYVTHHEG